MTRTIRGEHISTYESSDGSAWAVVYDVDGCASFVCELYCTAGGMPHFITHTDHSPSARCLTLIAAAYRLGLSRQQGD